MKSSLVAATLVLLGATALPQIGTAADSAPQAQSGACNRDCLNGVMDHYLDALVHHDAASLPWAPHARYTENNVEMKAGDGLWATISALGDYRLRAADVKTGEVALYGEVTETRDSSAYAVRLKVKNGQIAEAETLVVRMAEFGSLNGGVNPFAHPVFIDKPIMSQALEPGQRRTRAQLIAVANGYFDTLQQNDGTLHTQFDPQCARMENGVQTTSANNKDLLAANSKGCEAQFKLGAYRYDDRLRARRFPLVDEERGLVLAGGFIDHSGRIGKFKLTDGTDYESPIRHPHSFCLLELFKIVDGRIRQIEAVFITVPYNMPSPWFVDTSKH